MVQVNSLEVQLVHAETKVPFKEHQKKGCGQVYVEVEPDTEYFISVKKIRRTDKKLLMRLTVDGKDIGYKVHFHEREYAANYYGLLIRQDGVDSNKALKFEKARFDHSPAEASLFPYTGVMGQVGIRVCEGHYVGQFLKQDLKSTFEAAPGCPGPAKKKLRSAEGQVTDTRARATHFEHFEEGKELHSITVKYCAAPGLIAAGILPRPPPSSSRSAASAIAAQKSLLGLAKVTTKVSNIDGTRYDFIDLSGVPECADEGGGGGGDGNGDRPIKSEEGLLHPNPPS